MTRYQLQSILRRVSRVSAPAREVGQALADARHGGWLTKGVAAVRIASVFSQFDPDPFEGVLQHMQQWRGRGDVFLEAARRDTAWLLSEDTLPADVVGRPSPEEIAADAQKLQYTRGTVLLFGPTGTGKTTLARHIARRLHPGKPTLRLPGTVLAEEQCLAVLRRAVDVLDLGAIVIDDLCWPSRGSSSAFPEATQGRLLSLFEQLHGRVLVLVTVMADDRRIATSAQSLPRGEFYLEGLRPGRVDRVVVMPPPDTAGRKAILEHYGGDTSPEVLKSTQGLTGAYLKVFAQRHPKGQLGPGWKHDARVLLATSPVLHSAKSKGMPDFWRQRVWQQGRTIQVLQNQVQDLRREVERIAGVAPTANPAE